MDFVKEYKAKDYKEYLERYDRIEDFLKECFLMYNIAMKIKDDRRNARLEEISMIAIKRDLCLSSGGREHIKNKTLKSP